VPSEAATAADFTIIRYAQVWEDADILLEALDIRPEDECLSIASAGDNALAMLARGPRRVIALDMNPSQLACLELRVAAFRRLDYPEILELIGSRVSKRRIKLYQAIRLALSGRVRAFWDARQELLARGVGSSGKFENYFRLFRERVMPLVHSRRTISRLLEGRDLAARQHFYNETWNTWRWRVLFHLFFSRSVMGTLGRDPSFFRYVEGNVAERILSRTRHALTELDPSTNPYLQWILTGWHQTALPFYLREENVAAIRENLDRLEWHLASLEDFLSRDGARSLSKFNLSDIFEYLSVENAEALLYQIAASARPGARLAYWNMLAPRCASEALRNRIRPLSELAGRLHLRDKAFFYSAFVVEEIL
jgi:S-adenosylmethionine:diacylglycerol 3-amino-3-carboxypropyl transferase